MPNLGTSAPAGRSKVHKVKSRRKLTTPTIHTIHTHGTPDVENEVCRWSWIAFDAAGKEVTRADGVRGGSYRVTSITAKFHAVIEALAWVASNIPNAPVTVLSDLELAVGMVNGKMKAEKPHVKLLTLTAGQFLSRTKATVALMRHEQNRAAQPPAKDCLVAKDGFKRV